jgi:CRISPR/Cas system-associated endonuclease Cas1
VYQLTPGGRKLFLQQFETRLNTEIQHPVFGYKATYRRCLELQARLLAKFLLGELPTYRPFQIR